MEDEAGPYDRYLDLSADVILSEGESLAHDSAHVHGTKLVSHGRTTRAVAHIILMPVGAGSGMKYRLVSPGHRNAHIRDQFSIVLTQLCAEGWGGSRQSILVQTRKRKYIGNAMLYAAWLFVGLILNRKEQLIRPRLVRFRFYCAMSRQCQSRFQMLPAIVHGISTVKLTAPNRALRRPSIQNIDGATTYFSSAQ